MRALHFGTRRLLAAGALLLASCLEICGCSPVQDCQRVLGLQMSSLNWQTLVDRCAQCLTTQELNTLSEGQERFTVAGATMPFRAGETVRQALQENAGPSFYEIANPDRPATTSRISDLKAIETVPQFNRATPYEVKFAPSSIPESVLFLYLGTEPGGAHRRVPSATAFVISVPGRGNRTLARFLVTARHVVDPAWARCSEQNPASMQVRLNRRSGGVGYETISLADEQGRPRYFTPRDPTADIAILRLDRRLVPDIESYKFVDTPFGLLPTDSELGYISSRQRDLSRNLPGQSVTTASLRTQVPAEVSAFPLSEFGVLFSTANEPVNIQCGNRLAFRPLRVWFIDASVDQGVSGAPVYTLLARNGEASPSTVLLGVQAIAWPDRGVAGITPASALAELVETVLGTRSHSRERAILYAQEQHANLYRGATP